MSKSPGESRADTPYVKLMTDEGEITLELWPGAAPAHVENFLRLIQDGFYDGLIFHRIIPRFVLQAGCPHGDGTGGPGWTIPAEFNDRPHQRGTLSMARGAEPDSAGSQFFICLTREYCQHLDHHYTAFGQVVEGLEVVDALASSPLTSARTGQPLHPPAIHHAETVESPESV